MVHYKVAAMAETMDTKGMQKVELSVEQMVVLRAILLVAW